MSVLANDLGELPGVYGTSLSLMAHKRNTCSIERARFFFEKE